MSVKSVDTTQISMLVDSTANFKKQRDCFYNQVNMLENLMQEKNKTIEALRAQIDTMVERPVTATVGTQITG